VTFSDPAPGRKASAARRDKNDDGAAAETPAD